MVTRQLLALLRCLALVGLAAVGLLLSYAVVVAATLVVPYPVVSTGQLRLARLGRRLARRWGGVDFPDPERTSPPVPRRRPDGWYAHGNQLYRWSVVPAFLARLEWVTRDPTHGREWLWLLLTPVTGGLAAAVPPALVVAGAAALVVGATALGAGPAAPFAGTVPILRALPSPLVVVVGGAAVGLGLALAPAMVRLHARWTAFQLRAGSASWTQRTGIGRWIGRGYRSVWPLAGLGGLAVLAFGGFLLTLLAAVVSRGRLMAPVSAVTRPLLGRYRQRARAWAGAELPEPYRPFPTPPAPDSDGSYRVGRGLYPNRAEAVRAQRQQWVVQDPATWRDLLWMGLTPPLAVLGALPAALVCVGLFGLVWQVVIWPAWALPIGLLRGDVFTAWYLWYFAAQLLPALDVVPGWLSVPIGFLIALAGLALGVPMLRLRQWWDGLLLAPTRASLLAQRVARLTETRADAVDSEAAELRRIERDLHDGAQARLIAVGLSLASVERLMETDPAQARDLLARAQETSATALAELRGLVRGIHPPVLAERGLVDAVRAVALDTPLPVSVTADLPGRPAPPVESAAYFAVCEALANAARHGGAKRVEIDIRHRAGLLRITVTDDGRGGADPERGTGLLGVRRRLGTFDGTLTVHSPAGGPTVLTMELPCPLPPHI